MDKQIKTMQNLDTNFLKLIAIISMAIDHVGKIFFPGSMLMAITGRIAFPLFAYCLVVGCLYTSNFKRYVFRLAVFAAISQPVFNMAFHPTLQQFMEEFFSVNIFFTLIAGVLMVKAFMDSKKYWWLALVSIAMEILIGLDYGLYGIILMLIFYLCRERSILSAVLALAWMLLWGGFGDFAVIGPIGLDLQAFAVLALPFIYLHTNIKPKINKYFFYAFYPAHLLLIFLVRILLHI